MVFRDRSHAGRLLAERLLPYAGRQDLVVFGLPRGGIVVASEVADALNAPLDVFVVRKLGVPGHPETTMGALASGGVRVLHDALAHQVQAADPGAFDRVLEREQREVERRVRLYRGEGHPRRTLTGRITFVIDDGMTTGATMEAAVEALHALRPGWLVAAVPVAPHAVCQRLRHQVDELVCLLEPPDFQAEGDHYAWFEPVDDEEVQALLRSANVRQTA
ncbi:MAG TPA: phosphoribosyltransferase family protein [Candidatus Polarisedimenticolaceae bacterium]|nr:phosphoribosyltransferase family protein [Candidatus Polarisedimenticolaceae bacterium]